MAAISSATPVTAWLPLSRRREAGLRNGDYFGTVLNRAAESRAIEAWQDGPAVDVVGLVIVEHDVTRFFR
jgi:hypothetical protein